MFKVFKIGITKNNNQEIQEVKEISLSAGKGIIGDRYYHEYNEGRNQLTLIESENIDYYNNKFSLKIPYLNVDLDFEKIADVNLEGRSFKFDDIGIIDTQYKTQAKLNGSITYDHFKDWYLDLYLDTEDERFLVLNTKMQEESLYYGTGFISGKAQI